MEQLSINLNKEIFEKLKQEAKEQNKDINQLVKEVLNNYLYLKRSRSG